MLQAILYDLRPYDADGQRTGAATAALTDASHASPESARARHSTRTRRKTAGDHLEGTAILGNLEGKGGKAFPGRYRAQPADLDTIRRTRAGSFSTALVVANEVQPLAAGKKHSITEHIWHGGGISLSES